MAAIAAGTAAAQTVTLNGTSGDRLALLVIDGLPRTLAVGQTVQGVKLLALTEGDARIEVAGRQLTLRIGAAPVKLGAALKDGAGTEVVLTAGSAGTSPAAAASTAVRCSSWSTPAPRWSR